MSKRILDYDPVTKTTVWHNYDELTGEVTIAEIQDVEQILESNLAVRNWGHSKGSRLNAYSKNGIRRGWWHVGTIPNNLIVKWRREEGINVFDKNHWDAVVKKLNDLSFEKIRTGTGRV